MQLGKYGQIALGLVVAIGGASAASADQPIERSGNTYHQAVCARGNPQGTARCFAHVEVDARGNPHIGKADGAAPNVVPGGYSPADLKSAYKITGTGSSATTIAIVDAYGYANAEADLAVYRAQYGLPACTTANGCFAKYNQSGVAGNYPREDSGWAQEAALDLDMASAMCSSCKIILVQATTPSFANLAAAVNTAAGKGAHVISNSYGGGEAGSSSYNAAYTHSGVAITASSGDSGYGVSFPASSPNVIAVGGTTLTRATNTRGFNETVWNGAGSGCSGVYAKPSWQTDPLCATRMEADISAVADPATGVAVYGPSGKGRGSAWLVFGGTSVSAPLIGGIYGVAATNVNASSSIYIAPSTAFFDVTSGSNGSCGGTYFCTAAAGYDGPTGRGTPNGTAAF